MIEEKHEHPIEWLSTNRAETEPIIQPYVTKQTVPKQTPTPITAPNTEPPESYGTGMGMVGLIMPIVFLIIGLTIGGRILTGVLEEFSKASPEYAQFTNIISTGLVLIPIIVVISIVSILLIVIKSVAEIEE
jgi:hypothetical protein